MTCRRLRTVAAVVSFALAALAPIAAARADGLPPMRTIDGVTLEGRFVQGALVIGHTDPGARVELRGKRVAVGSDGRFLLGFGVDAPVHERLVVARSGKTAVIPLEVAQRKYETQVIAGLPPSQVTPSPQAMVRIRAEAAEIQAARAKDTGTPLFHSAFEWPVRGVISGVYGSRRVLNGKPRSPHLGVDIAADEGTPVVAPTEGTVVLAGKDFFFTGNTLMIDHGQGLTTVYAHMSRLAVKVGDHVTRGQVIGAVGSTGRATGPHLHWGVHLGGDWLDPQLVAGETEPDPGALKGDAPAR